MQKYFLVVFALLFFSDMCNNSLFAQDPVFSQPFANPLYLNPAFSGTRNSQRIGLNYQYLLQEKYVTYNISYDRNFIDSNNSIGLLANLEKSDTNQALTTNTISIIYSRKIHIKTFTISAGIQANYMQLNLNLAALPMSKSPGGVYPVSEEYNRTTISTYDYSFGLLGYGKNYFFGLSFYHLAEPNESFDETPNRLPPKYSTLAGIIIPIGIVTISPIIISQQQGYIENTVTECYFNAWNFTVGIGHRLQDALIFTIGYQYNFIQIGYCYDAGLPTASPSISNPLPTAGSNEVSLAVLLPYKSLKLKKVNGLTVPAF